MNWNIVLIATIILVAIAIILGIALALGSKYLAVQDDKRVEDVTKLLPGLNCGGCGSAGCHQFANLLVDKKATVDKCRPSKAEQKQAINTYLETHK